jgi:hypothetical protein
LLPDVLVVRFQKSNKKSDQICVIFTKGDPKTSNNIHFGAVYASLDWFLVLI